MITKIFILILLSLSLSASTTTDTTFTNKTTTNTDSFGNAVFNQDVTIKTNNFKVDNFWSKFKTNGDAQSNHSTISKSATVEVSIESSSLCTIYSDLDTAGCSGQKPFLINNEALIGKGVDDTISLIFQKNYDMTNDVILYSDVNASMFYPLDIQRDEKYYKSQDDNSKSFFGVFGTIFNIFFGDDGFFSSFFNFGVTDNNQVAAEDIRQRYIANILSGVDQNHLLEKDVTALETEALNQPVSLIDYTEEIVEEGGCNLFFFKFSEGSTFCNTLGGLPFITIFSNTTPTTTFEIDTIQTDTENSLITFASTYTDMTISEYQSGTVYQAQSTDDATFINPISAMTSMIKFFLFGPQTEEESNMIEEPMDTYYKFDDENAVNMTLAITNNGDKIDNFQTFKLTGIHSLTGNERMCRVKESNDYDDWTDYTFKPEGTSSQTFTDLDAVETETWCSRWGEDSPLSDGWCSSFSRYEVPTNLDTVQTLKTPDEWLSWCDDAMEDYTPTTTRTCDYIFFFPVNCRDVIDPIFVDGYEIAEYVNTSKRGLILDLKLIDLDINDKANTVRYKIKTVR